MAKKLIYNYTFDASAKTIVINGNFKLRKLQLITNVTDGIIVYNFADSTKGGSVSFNSETDETTITLEHDTTSMSDSDELQIFVDIPEDKVEFVGDLTCFLWQSNRSVRFCDVPEMFLGSRPKIYFENSFDRVPRGKGLN